MKILLNVNYNDNTGKFWQDSYIKNKKFTLPENKSIHDMVAEIVKETDGVILSYKNKPQTNVFIDSKDGDTIPVGYIYRGTNEIFNDTTNKWQKAFFDVWVEIQEVKQYPIEIL